MPRAKSEAREEAEAMGGNGPEKLRFREWQKNLKVDPELKRDLKPGFLLPYLLTGDMALWKRWDYWSRLVTEQTLPAEPLPKISYLMGADSDVKKMLTRTLDCIPNHGSWESWGGWDYFRYLLDWLLYGFGHPGQPELPPEPYGCTGASMRLYQTFNLASMQMWPYDYWGDLLSDTAYGRQNAFYPTPMPIVTMMCRMTMSNLMEKDFPEQEVRTASVMDPCLGTGRFLLDASNYSLRLYGMDIDATMIKASLVNAYMYAPWMARPIAWLDGELRVGNSLSQDAFSTWGPKYDAHIDNPQAQGYLAGSKHDSKEQWKYAPILKGYRPEPAHKINPSDDDIVFAQEDDHDYGAGAGNARV